MHSGLRVPLSPCLTDAGVPHAALSTLELRIIVTSRSQTMVPPALPESKADAYEQPVAVRAVSQDSSYAEEKRSLPPFTAADAAGE